MDLKTRIRTLRKDRNLNQDELGEKIGLSCRVISALERGESKPSAEDIIALSEFFGVSADYLLTGKEGTGEISQEEREVINLYREDGQMRKVLKNAIEFKKKAISYLETYNSSEQHKALVKC
jgi:transcriptional regulator with XRE-family HTH domain